MLVAMTAGVELAVAAEVREWVEPGDLDRLAAMAAGGYRCVSCGRRGKPGGGPASVVVVIRPGAPGGEPSAVVNLAHARCLASQVRHEPDPLAAPGAGSMSATAAVLPYPGPAGPRALLITELTTAVVARARPAEPVDMTSAVLLGDGLHLLPDAWQPAPPAAGWAVLLPSPRSAVVLDPHGGRYYDGDLDQPAPWRRLAAARGTVELIAGVAGTTGGRGNPGPRLRTLEAAARAGRLVGGTVIVRPGRDAGRTQ